MIQNYLQSVKKQFLFAKTLGDQCFDQLSDDDLFWRHSPENNSIAVIVNHLNGNMLSRWTDFLTSDGEKKWRQRDQEFEEIITSRAQLISKWEEGWKVLFTALESINEENYNEKIYIRNQGHTITEAINRQLGHYSYHIGQIVFIAKMRSGEKWNSLSIPKGKSSAYNANKFAKEKHTAHFSDEFTKKEK